MASLTPKRRVYDSGVASSLALLPDAPALWSYSALNAVETCPRRYVLSHADYPDLWDQRGYPPAPVPAAMKGNVVHGSLEIILRAMVKARCPTTRSPEAVAVLRALGGYTAVAQRVLDSQFARFDGNPRVDSDRRQQLRRAFDDWIASAREQIQTYLNRLELNAIARPVTTATVNDPATVRSRYPIGPGDYPEQELVADDLRLAGRVDLLSLTPGGAMITDFKTGAEDASHHDQLRLYALLWHTDTAMNPGMSPVIALIAKYANHEVAVPIPDASELTEMAGAVKARVKAADAAVVADTPIPVVGEYCGVCNVRVLCDAYWSTGTRKTADVAGNARFDLEGVVVRQHGVKSWVLRESRTGSELVVRTPVPSTTLPVGETVRILGARRTVDRDDEEALIVSLERTSETHRLAARQA